MSKQIILLTAFLIIIKSNTFSQNTIDKDFDCYDGSQAEINACSYEELNFYDSILVVNNNDLITAIDKIILKYSKDKDTSHVKEYTELKKLYIESHKVWELITNKKALIVGLEYEGGSVQSYEENQIRIIETQKRIKYIKEILVEYK